MSTAFVLRFLDFVPVIVYHDSRVLYRFICLGVFGCRGGVRKVRVTLMIEAVNSTIANATAVRGLVGQIDSASVPAVSNVVPLDTASAPEVPQAPFISPYISVDLEFDKAVLQIRNSETGDVEQQFPTQSRMAQISQAKIKQEQRQLAASSNAPKPAQPAPLQSSDIVTVQEVTSSQPANTTSSTPQVAVAALSAGAQAGQSASSAGVTLFA